MNKYTGSDFDEFLREEGILEEVTARAHKRLLSLQLNEAMEASKISKVQLAEKLQTSRSQIDRLLDPDNTRDYPGILGTLRPHCGPPIEDRFGIACHSQQGQPPHVSPALCDLPGRLRRGDVDMHHGLQAAGDAAVVERRTRARSSSTPRCLFCLQTQCGHHDHHQRS